MTSSAPAVVEVRGAGGVGIRATFVRRGDRFAHVLSRLEGEQENSVWESVEGTDQNNWPPSPPLQQLSVETLPDGRQVALLVGMAGTSHWSMSVEPAADGLALIFDVACRAKGLPLALGSRYRRCGKEESPEALQIMCAEHTNVPPPISAAHCEVRRAGSQVSIFPLAPSEPMPRTVRWKYRVSV